MTSSAAEPLRAVHVLSRELDGTVLLLDDRVELPLNRLEFIDRGRLDIGGAVLSLDRENERKLEVAASVGGSVVVTVEGMPGFEFRIPPGATALFAFDLGRALADVETPESNSADVLLSAPDGGGASVPPSSSLRLDVYRDQTYLILGTGHAWAWNGDGQKVQLNSPEAWAAGGPLKAGQPGEASIRRLTPMISIEIDGDPAGSIAATDVRQTHHLSKGERLRLTYGNGAVLILRHDAELRLLEWEIDKGLFDISLSTMPGWKITAHTDQAGELQWNQELKMVDARNTGLGQVRVTLPSRTMARVPAGTSLQCSFLNAFTFTLSASGGAAALKNLDTGLEASLAPTPQVFAGGQLRQAASAGLVRPSKPLRLAWDVGAPLELQGLVATTTLPPDSEQVFNYDAEGQLGMRYTKSGQLEIVALEGSYRLELSAKSGLAVELMEGDAVTLALDLKKGTFRVVASELNAGAVRVTTPDGSKPLLGAASAINFNFGPDGAMVARSGDGALLLFEPAGDGEKLPAQPSTPDIIQQEQDVSRLPTPPLSPTGG